MMYYSALTKGFYRPGVHTAWPADSVEISDEQWHSLLAGQAQGATIIPDQQGYPTLSLPRAIPPVADPAPPSVALARFKVALYRAGRLADADAFIAAMTGDEADVARIAWAGWDYLSSASPLLAGIADALGLPIDELLRSAASISL